MCFRSFVTLAFVVAVGCAQAPEPVPEPDRLYIQLLTSAVVSGRWEYAAERGLGRIAAEFDADVSRIQCRENVRPLAEIGGGLKPPDVVFCVGLGFESTLPAVAPEYAETTFIVLPAAVHAENVTSLSFRTDGVGYLAGVLAAVLSESRDVGIIRGPGGDWLNVLETGFSKGFSSRRRRSNVVFAEGIDGPWDLVRQGVEVALYAGDQVDEGVIVAAHNAGLKIVAVDSELLVTEPDVVVAAVRIDVSEAMLRAVQLLVQGEMPDVPLSFGLASGVVDLELGADIEVLRDPAVHEALEAARNEVISGIFEIEQFGL